MLVHCNKFTAEQKKSTENKRNNFCKKQPQVGMDLQNVWKQGRKENTFKKTTLPHKYCNKGRLEDYSLAILNHTRKSPIVEQPFNK